jgi:hypothetical protein
MPASANASAPYLKLTATQGREWDGHGSSVAHPPDDVDTIARFL